MGHYRHYSLQNILLVTLFTGCMSCSNHSEEQLESLYRQRIPNSSQVVYEFSYGGSFVTSNTNAGWAILDSSDSFSQRHINKLPCTYFAAPPATHHLKMLDIHSGQEPRTPKDTLLTPVRRYSEKVGSFQIHVSEYHDTYGSPTTSTGLMEYEFEGLQETADSLTFYQLTRKFGGKVFPMVTAFAKGNIKVVDSAQGNIEYIEIKQAVMERGAIYRPGKPLELVPDQPVVGFAFYRFYPKKETKASILTDYGIFKRVQ